MANRGQRVLADFFAANARRHAGTHDGADRRTGDNNRADAQLVESLDNMDMGEPAGTAATERKRDRRLARACRRNIHGGYVLLHRRAPQFNRQSNCASESKV
ncbi:hypothetical protein D3C87_1538970 [compost metagenome]